MNFKSIFVMLVLLTVSAVGVASASSSIYLDYGDSSVLYVGEEYDVTFSPSASNFTFTVVYDPELTQVSDNNLSEISTYVIAGGQSEEGRLSWVVMGDLFSPINVSISPVKAGDTITMSLQPLGGGDAGSLTLTTAYPDKSGGGTGAASVVSVSGTAPVPSETPTVTDEPVVEPTETSVPVDGNDSSDAGSSDDGSSTEKTVPGLGLMGILGGLGVTAFMARRRKA